MTPYAFLGNHIPVLLAPMSGVTDAPFRKQAARFGSRVTITEMVAGEELIRGHHEAATRLTRPEGLEGTHVVQLVGRDQNALRSAAHIACENGADVIDINMGCPSRRVTGGLSGSALMKDIDHAESLIDAVLSGAGSTPVTLKMRLGWDWDTLNAPELAERAERLGVQLVTIHGRTRQDFYKNAANWEAIRPVKEAVSLPVIANGDITDVKTARKALSLSHADGVMIGRAATGRPWLIGKVWAELNGLEFQMPDLAEQINSLLDQADDSIRLYGEAVGIRVMRKHISAALDDWQLSRMIRPLDRDQKARACQADSLQELKTLFRHLNSTSLEFAA